MKKLIIITLALLSTFVVVKPAMAQTNAANLTRIQQVKEHAVITVNYTSTGVTVTFTGRDYRNAVKLTNIYYSQLYKRGWSYGTYGQLGDMTFTPAPNGFSINMNSTKPAVIRLIHKSFANMNFLAKFTVPVTQLLASHGIK